MNTLTKTYLVVSVFALLYGLVVDAILAIMVGLVAIMVFIFVDEYLFWVINNGQEHS